MASSQKQWYVYLVQCADSTLYSGVTTDLDRRVREHNGEFPGRGAKYTKARRPVKLVYSEECADRSAAGKAEAALRKLSRVEKLKLFV